MYCPSASPVNVLKFLNEVQLPLLYIHALWSIWNHLLILVCNCYAYRVTGTRIYPHFIWCSEYFSCDSFQHFIRSLSFDMRERRNHEQIRLNDLIMCIQIPSKIWVNSCNDKVSPIAIAQLLQYSRRESRCFVMETHKDLLHQKSWFPIALCHHAYPQPGYAYPQPSWCQQPWK